MILMILSMGVCSLSARSGRKHRGAELKGAVGPCNVRTTFQPLSLEGQTHSDAVHT